MNKFWMVLGSGNPTYRHHSKKAAQTEAERLARLNPGCEFVVLESVAKVKKVELQWQQFSDVELTGDSDVPF